ncbi:hypothetical protein BD414DRAFT_483314 [Trametes punicea]|nr:hypothetical protein BD414DRAFT_483314 [Trametes punicea]
MWWDPRHLFRRQGPVPFSSASPGCLTFEGCHVGLPTLLQLADGTSESRSVMSLNNAIR